MKKVLVILAVLLPLMSWGQSFTLTPEGWMSTEEPTNNYIVFPMEGTKAELFQKAKTAVTATFKSAKDVMSYNEPDIITINGYTDCIFEKILGMKYVFGMRYTMQILFKDGKVRFNAPDAYEAEYTGQNRAFFYLRPGGGGIMEGARYVFNKKGELKKKDQKKQAEDYFNNLVYTIIEKMKGGGTVVDEDW